MSSDEHITLSQWLYEQSGHPILATVKLPYSRIADELREQLQTQQAKHQLDDQVTHDRIIELESEVNNLKAPLMRDRQVQILCAHKYILENLLQRTLQEKEDAEHEVSECKKHVAQLETQVSELEDKVDELEDQISELEEEVSDLEDQVSSLEDEVDALDDADNDDWPRSTSASSRISTSASQNSGSGTVVVTKNSRKFHRPTCPYLADVAPQYKTYKSKSAAAADGGRACRTCCP